MYVSVSAIALIIAACLAPEAKGVERMSIDNQVQEEFTWVESEEDIAKITELAKSGHPKIKSNAKVCAAAAPYTDAIGKDQTAQLCLKWKQLPEQLLSDLILNNQNRFTNESDYDQRITKFYAFEHDGSLHRDLSTVEIDRLFKTFSATISFTSKYGTYNVMSTSAEDAGYLTSLSGLFVGTSFQDQPETFLYAKEFFQGATVKSVVAAYEVGLYPGGGFTTKFELFISEKHLIFVKTEGWNS